MAGGEGCADCALLRDAGLLLSPNAPVTPAAMTSQMAVLGAMRQGFPKTFWSVVMSPDTPMFEVPDETGGRTSVVIEIGGAVPIPAPTTPMARLVRFKADHGDLTGAVHDAVDGVRRVIEQVPEDGDAILSALAGLGPAFAALNDGLAGAGIAWDAGWLMAYANGPHSRSMAARARHLDGRQAALLAAGGAELLCRLAVFDDPVPTDLRDRLYSVVAG